MVGNKLRSPVEKEIIGSLLPGFEFLGFIPYDQTIVDADLANASVIDSSQAVISEVKRIYQVLVPV